MKTENLQEQIREIRQEKGVTLRVLGDKSGVPHTSISLIERSKKHPNLETYCKLLDSLGYELEVRKKE